jgi:hypothetical protein
MESPKVTLGIPRIRISAVQGQSGTCTRLTLVEEHARLFRLLLGLTAGNWADYAWLAGSKIGVDSSYA